MVKINFLSVPVLLILGIFVCCCRTATVEFYSDTDFKGAVHATTSSASCKELPTAFQNVNGSVKTTGCIIVYQHRNCDEEIWGYLVKSAEGRLSELPEKYNEIKGSAFAVSSFRDCTELEGRNEVDFDYYDKKNFEGHVTQFRNVCSCTNLPSSNSTVGMSVKLYGNCFKVYDTTNCDGVPPYTTHDTYFKDLHLSVRLIEPCHPPQRQCEVRITGIVDWVLPGREGTLSRYKPQVPETHIFINNDTNAIERYFEVTKEINETLKIQLFNVTSLMHNISGDRELFRNANPTNNENLLTVYTSNSATTSYTQPRVLSESLVHSPPNLNGTVVLNLERRIEINIREKLIHTPCTKLNVTWLAEMIDEDMDDYEVYFRVRASIGGKPIYAESIPFYFEGLNFYTKEYDITAVLKTTEKVSRSYLLNIWINVNTESIPSCWSQFLKFSATVINISPITDVSNLLKQFQRIKTANQQTFINNGYTQLEEYYEAANDVTETGQFQLSPTHRFDSFVFGKDLQIDDEPSIPFLTSVWDKLKRGEMAQDQKNLSINKTYEVQEYIGVSACTQYDVRAFVQMAKNVQIEYKVRLRMFGEFESDSYEEIMVKLEGFTIIRIEDKFTVVVETTGKLILNYGIGAGVIADGTPIQGCYERHAAFAGNCKFVCSA